VDEFLKVVVEGGTAFVFNILLIVSVAGFAWWRRKHVTAFLDDLRIKSFGVSTEGLQVERFEDKVKRAYVKQNLGPPSEDDKVRIKNIRRKLAPLIAGRRLLWVDDNPVGNTEERAAFVDMRVDVQASRSTAEALRELQDPGNVFDVVISDWRRPHDDKPDEPAGIGLLHELQDHKIQVPVVFYHGKVSQEELANRRKLALSNGAIGTTGSPGELLEMTAGALVQGAMRSEAQP